MKYSLLTASALTCLASASTIGGQEAHALNSWKRGSPQAPNGYAPAEVDCPSTRPSIRVASDISDEEKSWLQKRRPNTIQPMREMLTRMNITGFDVGAYFSKHENNATALPNVGIAFSGGGYRAMMNGAGALSAFDNRTPGAIGAGGIGGLLQSATYIAGLSGGSWLVGSVYSNNFTTVSNTISQNDDGDVWQLDRNILQGPKQGGIQILNTADYYKNLLDSVMSKEEARGNFNLSLTDYWGRALSFQLINATDGGPGYTWSSIQDDNEFKNGNAPMPIIVALERAPNERILSLNATDIEFNPFEIGSFDPTLYGFVPTKYIGSNFSNGELPDNQGCVAGFDNAGFIMGTSSSLFNAALLDLRSYVDLPDFLTGALEGILTVIGNDSNDIADYTPNPFKGYRNGSNPSAETDRLTLVDGGLDLQNIPFNPLIQPVRAVDVIFAVDSSADIFGETESALNWPNGTSLVATYERTYNESMQNGTAFPHIPDTNTFVNLGLNNRPTFFGCNSSNLTAEGPAPLIVYLPNSPYMFKSNVSTFTMSYSESDRNNIILNGYNVATQANGSRADAQNWPTCVGCAVLQRSMERNGEDIPEVCQQCFTKYCWNGELRPETPQPYRPSFILQEVRATGGAGAITSKPFHFALAVAVSALLLL